MRASQLIHRYQPDSPGLISHSSQLADVECEILTSLLPLVTTEAPCLSRRAIICCGAKSGYSPAKADSEEMATRQSDRGPVAQGAA